MDSRRVQQFDAYVTYTATRTVDGADERAAHRLSVTFSGALKGLSQPRPGLPHTA